ncbi:MAG: hypothetical protein ABIO44_11085 [Saprospiraceae bacterium]
MNRSLNIIVTVLFIATSCTNNDNTSTNPSIQLIGLSKQSMLQGDLNQDSLLIQISFKDGDGDLGWGSSDSRKDIFVIDKRINLISDQFKIPDIPNSNGKPIEGELLVRLFTTCCLFPNNIPPCSAPPQYPFDTINYEIYIKDRAGNESNHIVTESVQLRCN